MKKSSPPLKTYVYSDGLNELEIQICKLAGFTVRKRPGPKLGANDARDAGIRAYVRGIMLLDGVSRQMAINTYLDEWQRLLAKVEKLPPDERERAKELLKGLDPPGVRGCEEIMNGKPRKAKVAK